MVAFVPVSLAPGLLSSKIANVLRVLWSTRGSDNTAGGIAGARELSQEVDRRDEDQEWDIRARVEFSRPCLHFQADI